MPKPKPFPSGPIGVSNQHLLDMSAGMNWDMRDASNVRFLAVRGTIWVGDCQTTYNFTLVEYQLYIDEVPWLIFSTLADVLENEFEPTFWETVNYGRKDLDTGPIVQGAVRIDGELVLKRFVARNVKPKNTNRVEPSHWGSVIF